MFSRIKSVVSQAKSAVQSYVVPTIFSIGKVVSSVGGSVFNGFMIAEHFSIFTPYKIPIAIISASCNALVNLVTRVPALFNQFNAHQNQQKTDMSQVINNDINESEIKSDKDDLGCGGQTAVLLVRILGIVSGICASPGAYLGGITLCESIRSQIQSDHLDDNAEINHLIQAISILLSVSCYASYHCYNVRYMEKTTRDFIQSRKNGDFQFNYKHAITLLISLISVAPMPFVIFFSTTRSIIKFPFTIPVIARNSVAAISSITATLTSFLSTVPALYNYFFSPNNINDKQQDDPLQDKTKLPCWWSILRLLTIGGGVGDSIAAGFGNYISILKTLDAWSGIGSYNPYASIATIPFFFSTGLINQCFSVHRGTNNTENILLKKEKKSSDVEDQADEKTPLLLENNQSEEEIIPAIYPNIYSLFSNPTNDSNDTQDKNEIKRTLVQT